MSTWINHDLHKRNKTKIPTGVLKSLFEKLNLTLPRRKSCTHSKKLFIRIKIFVLKRVFYELAFSDKKWIKLK